MLLVPAISERAGTIQQRDEPIAVTILVPKNEITFIRRSIIVKYYFKKKTTKAIDFWCLLRA